MSYSFRPVPAALNSSVGPGPDGAAGRRRWESTGQYSRMFDPKNLETFTGEVTTVDQLTPGYGMSDRVWLGLQTDKKREK